MLHRFPAKIKDGRFLGVIASLQKDEEQCNRYVKEQVARLGGVQHRLMKPRLWRFGLIGQVSAFLGGPGGTVRRGCPVCANGTFPDAKYLLQEYTS